MVFEKKRLQYFSLFQNGKGGNIAATLSFYVENFFVPNKLARLGWARLGIKGFSTLFMQLVYPVIFMLPDYQ